MAGAIEDKRKKRQPTRRSPSNPDDPCDLHFIVDLVGVQIAIIPTIHMGATLQVAVSTLGEARSVVCVTKEGAILGSLAAFRGLAQLINCLEQGVKFVAAVQSVSPTHCTVSVYRVSQ